MKARSPEHPHRGLWRQPGRRTPRHVQVFATLHHALKIRAPGAGEARNRIKQLFTFRGWAVHPDAGFREPLLREEIDRGVEWHYAAFRAENAVKSVGMTLEMLDVMVELFERGSAEIRDSAAFARARLDDILDMYEAEAGLPPFARARDQKAAVADADDTA